MSTRKSLPKQKKNVTSYNLFCPLPHCMPVGNSLFKAKEFTKACDTYLECLMALDFGETEEQRFAVERLIQGPCLRNMAACLLEEKQWQKAEQLCTEALKLDARDCKALRRRAQARTEIGSLSSAIADIKAASLVAEDQGDIVEWKRINRAASKLREALLRSKRASVKEKEMAAAMVSSSGLYRDKDDVANSSSFVDDDNIPSEVASPGMLRLALYYGLGPVRAALSCCCKAREKKS